MWSDNTGDQQPGGWGEDVELSTQPGEKQVKRIRSCEVCGDQAIGHNFGVISCESCKAFFRRNAYKKFNCNFGGNCVVDKLTRKFCQHCRLQKSLFVGMKRELIQAEEIEQQAARGKRGRNKRMSDSRVDSSSSSSTIFKQPRCFEATNCKTEPKVETDGDFGGLRVSPSFGGKLSPSCSSTSSCVSDTAPGSGQTLQHEKSSSLERLIDAAIDAEFQTTHTHRISLNDREKARINELYMAARSLEEPFKDEEDSFLDSFESEPLNLISVINLTNLAIKRIIKMAKQVSAFTLLCQEDQVVLLKGGCLELMLLRSLLTFNSDNNTWQLPGGKGKRDLSMEVLREASLHGVNLYDEYHRFISSFCLTWRNDETIMLLMSAIALFNPDRRNLTHTSIIRLERDSYYYLLRRYLDSKYPGCESREVYLQLIGKLLHLKELNGSHLQLFMEMDPREIEPLLREIFDLNMTRP